MIKFGEQINIEEANLKDGGSQMGKVTSKEILQAIATKKEGQVNKLNERIAILQEEIVELDQLCLNLK